MSLLKPTPRIPEAEQLFNELEQRRSTVISGWNIFALWSAIIVVSAFVLRIRPAFMFGGVFAAILGITNLTRSFKFLHWKHANKKALKEARAMMDKKKKRAAKLAAIQDKLDNLDREFSSEELRQNIQEQATATIDLLEEDNVANSQLVSTIRHNVAEANKIIDFIEQIDNEMEEHDADFLEQEKRLYANKVAATTNPEIQRQLYETIALLDQRQAQARELAEKRQLLRAKIASFQQAIENVRLKATNYRSKNIDSLNNFNGAKDLTNELEIMDKVQSELDEISYGDEKWQQELAEMRRRRQSAARNKDRI